MGEFFAGLFILIYCTILGLIQTIWYVGFMLRRLIIISWHEFRLMVSIEYNNEIKFCENLRRLDLIEYCYEKHPFQYIWKRFNRIMHNLDERDNL